MSDFVCESTDWFVVRTNSRHEKKVACLLEKLNYQVYLPIQKQWRIWSDRKKLIEVPLIPGVIFVHDCTVNKEKLYSVPGFHSILKLNGEIGRVKPKEIEQLKLVLEEYEGVKKVENSRFSRGEEVEIIAGPLRGYFAKAVEDVNSYRVIICIEALAAKFVVNLAKSKVRKLVK
ncbi:MAG TPA: UpxY family transcription antiterminator [Brumimicrobium sp.]|nr:UpxY family transcription antiterminator [Brumimicrobium sp.]